MPIAIGSLKSAVRWMLSKSELIISETIVAELGNNSLCIARVGDWEVLQGEFSTMERILRASGLASYSAPSGKYDDPVMAVGLAIFRRAEVDGGYSAPSPNPALYAIVAFSKHCARIRLYFSELKNVAGIYNMYFPAGPKLNSPQRQALEALTKA